MSITQTLENKNLGQRSTSTNLRGKSNNYVVVRLNSTPFTKKSRQSDNFRFKELPTSNFGQLGDLVACLDSLNGLT